MTAPVALLRRELAAALSEMTAAETSLEEALGQLRGGVRAEKVTISAAVETAFERVRTARAELAKLREKLDDED